MQKTLLVVLAVFLSAISACCCKTCKTKDTGGNSEMYKTYKVHKLTKPMAIDANFKKSQWKKAKTIDITLFMGEKPEHQPKTQAKLLYDDENIYVCFRVEDNYVRAVA